VRLDGSVSLLDGTPREWSQAAHAHPLQGQNTSPGSQHLRYLQGTLVYFDASGTNSKRSTVQHTPAQNEATTTQTPIEVRRQD
jgi:hypothetical protein